VVSLRWETSLLRADRARRPQRPGGRRTHPTGLRGNRHSHRPSVPARTAGHRPAGWRRFSPPAPGPWTAPRRLRPPPWPCSSSVGYLMRVGWVRAGRWGVASTWW